MIRKELTSIPFASLAPLTGESLAQAISSIGFDAYSSWVLPQMVARFGSFSPRVRDGMLSPALTMKENIGDDPTLVGMWKVACRTKRSALVPVQTKAPEYSTLVPLILAGFKKYQNIEYSRWNREELHAIVEPDLAEAMLCDPPEIARTRLVEIRDLGLIIRTGKNAGNPKPAVSTWALTGVVDTELGHLPRLAQTMLTQIWVAHPTLRTSLMVLDPSNWDNMPEPLISSEIMKTPSKPVKKAPQPTALNDIPW